MLLTSLTLFCRYALSFDKDGIRTESVMGLAMVLTLKAAAGSVKGSDVNRQQRLRAEDRRTFVLRSRL